jgi:hypothetical protein
MTDIKEAVRQNTARPRFVPVRVAGLRLQVRSAQNSTLSWKPANCLKLQSSRHLGAAIRRLWPS